MKKFVALLLIVVTLLTLSACGSKDALAGTWSAELGADGTITWTFNGSGKCTMENAYGSTAQLLRQALSNHPSGRKP